MKYAITNADGNVEIIVPVNVTKTMQLFPTAVAVSSIPSDLRFQKSWTLNGSNIEFNLSKAKEIAHELRRQKRDELMAPYDDIVAKNIPGSDIQGAEQMRATIRAMYEVVQNDIDNAINFNQIEVFVNNFPEP